MRSRTFCCISAAMAGSLTSAVSPAGLQAGRQDAVPGLRHAGQLGQAAGPVLHSPDGTVLQLRHQVPDRQTPGPVRRRTLGEQNTAQNLVQMGIKQMSHDIRAGLCPKKAKTTFHIRAADLMAS